MRRQDIPRAVKTHIGITQVVGDHEDDIRLSLRSDMGSGQQKKHGGDGER